MVTVSPLRRYLGLIALVVLIPAALAAALSVDAWGYIRSRPFVSTDLSAGQTGRLGDLEVELVGSLIITGNSADGNDIGVPPGADLVIARLRMDPGPVVDDGLGECDVAFVSPSPAGDRRWNANAFNETDYTIDEPYVTSCPLGSGAPYEYQTMFLVPAGAADNGWIEVTTWSTLPQALRLR